MEEKVSSEKARQIAEQNDIFRTKLDIPYLEGRPAGRVFCTAGISALPLETKSRMWTAVMKFDSFDEDNGERDFGAISVPDLPEKIFWKIDYYADRSCTTGSEDPADPARTFRVLTIMLASEY
jgi:Protein of unknown function (DUF3768)